MGVAFFVATVIAGFALAFVFDTLLLFLVQINDLVSAIGFVYASGTSTVADVTVLTPPFRLARTIVVAHFVNTMAFVLARVVGTLVASVLLTSFARCSGGAAASEICSIIAVYTGPSVATRRAIARRPRKLTIVSKVSWCTGTMMRSLLVGANSAILARISLAKVSSGLTITAHPSWTTDTVVVVDQLNTLLCSQRGARIGQALVDISLASGSDIARRTLTFVSANFVNASTSMMTCSFKALVDVDFAKDANGPMRTSTLEVVDQVVTDAVILTGVGEAVVDVIFAILALEAFGAVALVGANEVSAGCSILTRIGPAFINLLLTIAPLITFGTNTLVTVSNVSAVASILAKLLGAGESRIDGRSLARYLSDIAKLPRPTGLALTLEGGASLETTGTVLAWRVSAPVDDLFAIVAGPSRGTLTSVISSIFGIIDANTAVLARIIVTAGFG